MKLISKSDGTELLIHSKKTSEAANIILNKSTDDVDEYSENIRVASLLHDIGKCTSSFQKYLKTQISTKKKTYTHNQIGWAFLSKHLKINKQDKDIILDAIYWHHGERVVGKKQKKKNVISNDSDIYDKLTATDINRMKEFLVSVIGVEYYKDFDVNDLDIDDVSSPNYFNVNDAKNLHSINSEKLLVRSCVIGADRFVSKYSKDELNKLSHIMLSNDIHDSICRDDYSCIKETVYDGSSRFFKQEEIIKKTEKTTIINAPAGFGKTLLGLMWGINKSNNKIIWVCPRNMVAKSVYESVKSELKNINKNLSVQLYLSNEVKDSTDDSGAFESDIVITNIDNLLYTSTNNNRLNLSYIVNTSNVIFDEYHELVTSGSIMSLFILMMSMRHRMLKVETLLLSATPIPTLNRLWESNKDGDVNTCFLPSEDEHYDAAHDEKYSISIVDEPIIGKNTNTLTIYNSIKGAQRAKAENDITYLLHSKFKNDTRNNHFKALIDLYGKNSIRNIPKADVVGTHIIQASLDISFNNLNESVLSPQSSLQRIGRCNRWGDYNGKSKINFFIPDPNTKLGKSERAVIDNLYDSELFSVWVTDLYFIVDKEITLNEIYAIYNRFGVKYKKRIQRYVKEMYSLSMDTIKNIRPIKYSSSKPKDETKMKVGSNILRSSGNEIYTICENVNGGYSEPFNEKIYSSCDKDFDEDSNTLNRMTKDMKRINDPRYDYSHVVKYNKKLTLDEFRRRASWSNQPYIRYDVSYHDDYGIISNNLCEELGI